MLESSFTLPPDYVFYGTWKKLAVHRFWGWVLSGGNVLSVGLLLQVWQNHLVITKRLATTCETELSGGHRLLPSHRLAWCSQRDGQLVRKGEWNHLNFQMDNMANILIGPTWIDHGPLELSHKSGKYFRKSGCWSFCPGIIILYLQSILTWSSSSQTGAFPSLCLEL